MSGGAESGEAFIAKWRARWPEWRIGQGFVAPDERARTEAWFALLDELTNAAWGGADPSPGLAKLAWWQDELQGWAKGARRHPLAPVLQRADAPWQTLALALRTLPATREHIDDPARDLTALRDLGLAIDACEARLFDAGVVPGAEAGLSATRLLAAKACLYADGALARTCLQRWPLRTGPRPRRIADAILRARLQGLLRTGDVRPAVGPTLVWRVWRAARA